jgi:hypothetical protein
MTCFANSSAIYALYVNPHYPSLHEKNVNIRPTLCYCEGRCPELYFSICIQGFPAPLVSNLYGKRTYSAILCNFSKKIPVLLLTRRTLFCISPSVSLTQLQMRYLHAGDTCGRPVRPFPRLNSLK